MFGSEVLEVAIALSFIYLILSLIASSVNELIARFINLRATTLLSGIKTLLRDANNTKLAQAIYQHPLIEGLDKAGKISYIPSQNFALALLDVLAPSSTQQTPPADSNARFEEVWRAVYQHDDPAVRQLLLPLLEKTAAEGKASLSSAAQEIEKWFNASMQGVTNYYKRRVQYIILTIAFVTVIVLNADSVNLANTMLTNSTARSAVVARAEAFVAEPLTGVELDEEGNAVFTPGALETLQAELTQLEVPFGWSTNSADPRAIPTTPMGIALKIVGLGMTIAAVSLGAPFWFDLLAKLLAVRGGQKQEE